MLVCCVPRGLNLPCFKCVIAYYNLVFSEGTWNLLRLWWILSAVTLSLPSASLQVLAFTAASFSRKMTHLDCCIYSVSNEIFPFFRWFLFGLFWMKIIECIMLARISRLATARGLSFERRWFRERTFRAICLGLCDRIVQENRPLPPPPVWGFV